MLTAMVRYKGAWVASRRVFLTICVLLLLGHICASPVAEAGGHGNLPGDEHGAIHAASCDGVLPHVTDCSELPSFNALAVALISTPTAPTPLLDRRAAGAIDRPPRFLLHAPLLI